MPGIRIGATRVSKRSPISHPSCLTILSTIRHAAYNVSDISAVPIPRRSDYDSDSRMGVLCQ